MIKAVLLVLSVVWLLPYALFAEVVFSHPAGFYQRSFKLQIGVSANAEHKASEPIYFSSSRLLDTKNFVPLSGLILIDATQTVKIARIVDGLVELLAIRTFIFPADVLQQNVTVETAKMWGKNIAADYELKTTLSPPELKRSLRALPAISLTIDQRDFDEPLAGIQSNPLKKGKEFEKQAYLELLNFGSLQTQHLIPVGLKVVGRGTRSPQRKKHNFRLVFRQKYGTPRLSFPVFTNTRPESFKNLILGSFGDDSWVNPKLARNATYMRNRLCNELQKKLGDPSVRQRSVHVFINSFYWGVYQLSERPDEHFMAGVFSGESHENFSVFKDADGSRTELESVQGNPQQWYDFADQLAALSAQPRRQLSYFRENVDYKNFLNYLLINQLLGNRDWDNNNFRIARKPDGRYVFLCWDTEKSDYNMQRDSAVSLKELIAAEEEKASFILQPHQYRSSGLHETMLLNPKYRLNLSARAQLLFEPTAGLLNYAVLKDILKDQISALGAAMPAEIARWGDNFQRKQGSYQMTDWQRNTNALIELFYPGRPEALLRFYSEPATQTRPGAVSKSSFAAKAKRNSL